MVSGPENGLKNWNRKLLLVLFTPSRVTGVAGGFLLSRLRATYITVAEVVFLYNKYKHTWAYALFHFKDHWFDSYCWLYYFYFAPCLILFSVVIFLLFICYVFFFFFYDTLNYCSDSCRAAEKEIRCEHLQKEMKKYRQKRDKHFDLAKIITEMTRVKRFGIFSSPTPTVYYCTLQNKSVIEYLCHWLIVPTPENVHCIKKKWKRWQVRDHNEIPLSFLYKHIRFEFVVKLVCKGDRPFF